MSIEVKYLPMSVEVKYTSRVHILAYIMHGAPYPLLKKWFLNECTFDKFFEERSCERLPVYIWQIFEERSCVLWDVDRLKYITQCNQ